MAIQPQPLKPARNANGIGFGILLFLYQIMICLFYGFWFGYNQVTLVFTYDEGQLFLVAALIILVVIGTKWIYLGFGLMNAYITNASFSGMGLTLLIFGLTLEHFFLIKAFWEKAGVSDPNNSKSFRSGSDVFKIGFVNYAQDRYDPRTGTTLEHAVQFFTHHSFVDAIACALANVVAFSSLVGRIKML